MPSDSTAVHGLLVDFAWDQWAQMGVLAAPRRRDEWVMDPEALVILTLRIARTEPRLFDEVLDWLWRNGRLVSVQRLRNLVRDQAESRRLVEAALRWVSVTNGAIRVPQPLPQPEGPSEFLFTVDDRPMHIPRPDVVFAAFGFTRQAAHPTGRSTRPITGERINLAFRLRLAFGVGSRAECVRCLLTDPRGELGVADIADCAGYAKRNVADAVASLAAAGMIVEVERRNERRYFLDRDVWGSFLDLDPAGPHRNWPALFRALVAYDEWLADRDEALSDRMRASLARDLIETIGADLAAVGIPLPPNVPGPAYLHGVEDAFRAALLLLAPTSAPAAGNGILTVHNE